MKWWYYIPVLFFFLGVVIFYHYKDNFGYPICENGEIVYVSSVWDFRYFFWDKGKDCLLTGFIYILLKKLSRSDKRLRTLITITLSIFFFALVRWLWEIISFLTGTYINTTWVTDLIVVIFILIWVFPELKKIFQWLKQKL